MIRMKYSFHIKSSYLYNTRHTGILHHMQKFIFHFYKAILLNANCRK